MRKKILLLSIFSLLVSGLSAQFPYEEVPERPGDYNDTCGTGYELRDVVNIDFGILNSRSGRRDINRDPSPNNPERFIEMSGISYDGSGEVEDGRYAIVADPRTTDTWAAEGFDHTGNGDGVNTFGGMLFVNGASTAITLFRLPIDVCEDTNLKFEAWFANAHNNRNSGFPQLTFSIVDTETGLTVARQQSDPALPVPNGTLDGRWTRVALSFNSGTSTSLRLEIRNETGGGTGNDFVIDDIKIIMCVPVIEPEWGNNLSAGNDIIKVECDAVTNDIPVTLNDTDTSNAVTDGLTWFAWQYSDDNQSTWTIFNAVDNISNNNGNYNINVPKESPNGQRAWRLVLANSQQRITDLINGAIATGCSSGVITSSILFECLPCLMPTVSLSANRQPTACIQEGVDEFITLTATVSSISAPEENWVVGDSNFDLLWFKNGIEISENKNNTTLVINLANEEEGQHRYSIKIEKASCPPVEDALNVTINAPMKIEIVARNEANESLPNNTTAMKRDVLLTVELLQGGTPNFFEWNSGDVGNELWVSPNQNTTYSVVATDGTCSATAEIEIRVSPLPNAFTPSNGEGDINSVFPVSADALNQHIIKYKNLTVYNRYGQEVYNGERRWNGTVNGNKLAAPGTYFYIITFLDDETLQGTIEVIKN